MSELNISKKEALQKIGNILKTFPQPPTQRLDIFTPGIYTRHLRMPADKIFLTECHKSEHQYAILFGVIDVWTEGKGWVRLKAPHSGITKPGTQRLFRTWTDVVWMTIHATDIYPKGNTDQDHAIAVQEITELIIDKSYNPYKKEEKMEVEL